MRGPVLGPSGRGTDGEAVRPEGNPEDGEGPEGVEAEGGRRRELTPSGEARGGDRWEEREAATGQGAGDREGPSVWVRGRKFGGPLMRSRVP